jgi:hypothetical protein
VAQGEHIHAETSVEPGGAPPFVSCASCGERIGVYERLCYELPDRSLAVSGLLSLPDDVMRLDGRVRWFHVACAPPRGHLRVVED